MATTYTININAISVAASKNMFAISNATGSGKVIRVYRIWLTNPGTAAVTGGIGYFILRRYNANIHSGGTAVNYIPHSSALTASAATPFTGISAVSGATAITSPGGVPDEITRQVKSFDEIAVGGTTLDELVNVPVMAVIHDSGYGDSTIQPIVLNANQSLLLATEALGTYAGTVDMFVELTIT